MVDGKKDLKNVFFLIVLPLVMILYFVKYHQIQHILLGSLVVLFLGIIIFGAYAKTKKGKSYTVLSAGIISVLAAVLWGYLMMINNPSYYQTNAVKFCIGLAVPMLVGIYLFYKYYSLNKKRYNH